MVNWASTDLCSRVSTSKNMARPCRNESDTIGSSPRRTVIPRQSRKLPLTQLTSTMDAAHTCRSSTTTPAMVVPSNDYNPIFLASHVWPEKRETSLVNLGEKHPYLLTGSRGKSMPA
jgi:hypothetical protein